MSEITHQNTENHAPIPTVKGYVVIFIILTAIGVMIELLIITGGGDPVLNFVPLFSVQIMMLGSYLVFIAVAAREIKKIRSGYYNTNSG